MAATDDAESQDAVGQNQKHDESYKSVLSNTANFLHFLKKYIAAPWTADISAADMETVEKSFVTPEYSEIDSDLIYKLKIKGSDVYFYVLVELQSQVDHTMPFRLLRYMVELLNYIFKNMDNKVRERKNFRLPAIVPIILYNGNDNWTVVRTYKEYTENYEIFGDNIIDFHYLLFDVKRTDEATILSTKKMLDTIFLLDKRRLENKTSTKEVEACLEKCIPDLPEDDALELFGWIKHILYKGDLSPESEEQFRNLLKGGKTMKHALEIWRDEYVGACVLEGERKGILDGERKKALEIADKLIAKGMSVNDVADATGLTVDEILQR